MECGMKTDRQTYAGVPTPCYIMEEDVTQAIIIPIDADKILQATMQPVHDVWLWPEDEPEPVLPEPVYPDCEDCE